MKLRVKNNSVRLRLTQGELARFNASGQVEEAIEFGVEPHQRFVYRLESSPEIAIMQATIENNRIRIFVPKQQADKWSQTGQVGIEFEQAIGNGKTLRLLIEKDFACLEPRAGDDDKDAFTHPLKDKTC
jgi:hypothetical protein